MVCKYKQKKEELSMSTEHVTQEKEPRQAYITTVLRIVVITRKAKPTGNRRRRHDRCAAYVRKRGKLNQWLVGGSKIPTQKRIQSCWPKTERIKKSNQRRYTLEITEKQYLKECTYSALLKTSQGHARIRGCVTPGVPARFAYWAGSRCYSLVLVA